MANRSPLGSPRQHGRIWRQQSASKRTAIFVPCPVAPPLRKPDDVKDINNANSDVPLSPNVPLSGYEGTMQSHHLADYSGLSRPLTPPVHLSEIIRQSSEEQELEEDEPLPPPPPEMTALAAPSPPPLQGSLPSGASTPPTPLTPKTPTTPTQSPDTKRWKITPKELAKRTNIFRFPPDKKTSAISKIKTEEVSPPVSPPAPRTPPLGLQRFQKQTSETKREISHPSRPPPPPPTALPPPPTAPPPPPTAVPSPPTAVPLPPPPTAVQPLPTGVPSPPTAVPMLPTAPPTAVPPPPTDVPPPLTVLPPPPPTAVPTPPTSAVAPPSALPPPLTAVPLPPTDVPTPPTVVPPPPTTSVPTSLRTKKGATTNQDDITGDLPQFPSTPPSRTPSIDVQSEFPPPPAGVGADEPVSPAYIIPRKPPRPNSGFLAKIAKFSEAKKPSEIAAEERRRRNESNRKNEDQPTPSRDIGRKNVDERISVALHNSLEDLLSHINESLPGIEETTRGTPPETKTPTNSLESSQEFVDHVGLFHALPGRDVTTITEEDMATKFDDADHEWSTSSKLENADQPKDDNHKFDDVFGNLDDVTAQSDDEEPAKPVLDDDLAAFLGLGDLDDCLNLIDEAIAAPKGNQVTASNQRTQPIGGTESGDSEDGEDYEFLIGNKSTFSGPLPSGSISESEDSQSNQATAANQSPVASLPTHTTGGADSDDSDDSKDYEFPVGNQSTFSGPLPSGSFSEATDDPHYENMEFLKACLQRGEAGRSETPDPPPFPEDVDSQVTHQCPDPAADDTEMKSLDEDQVGLYDVPQAVRTSQIQVIQEVEAEMEYDVPDITEDATTKKKEKKKKSFLIKQTSVTSAPSKHEQTTTSSPKLSKDRPPPPNDVPPKPQAKKTGKKKTWNWRRKLSEKAGKVPPLPPKDPDMLTGARPVLEEDGDNQYSSLDDIISRAQPEPEVIGDDDWNSDDNEILDDLDDWD